MKTTTYAGHGVEIEEDVARLRRRHLDRTVLLLVALYVCWGSAIPAMKLMVGTMPPAGGAALIFLLAGAGDQAAAGRPRRAGNCHGPRGRIRVMIGSPAR